MKNIRCKYKTGRSKRYIEINATKDKILYTYEISVVTPSGEFKQKEWEVLVQNQTKDLLETNIVELLKEYILNNLAWIKTEDEAYKYALNLYSSRIWESKEWLGHEEFNHTLNINDVYEQISLI